MLGHFNIGAAIQETLSEGRIVEVSGAESGVLAADTSILRIDGDASPGAVIKGDRSVVIEGSVVGDPSNPVQIAVGEDILIRGSVQNATLLARDVRVGASVTDSRLGVSRSIEVAGDVAESSLVAGDYQRHKAKLDEFGRELHALEEELEFVNRQLAIDEKRVYKLVTTTGFTLEGVVGNLVRLDGRQVTVNLTVFNNALKNRSSEDAAAALTEFYSKVVVAKLVKANRRYIEQNATRRKVFLGVVGDLNKLFRLAHRRDRIGADVRKARASQEAGITWFNGLAATIWLGGGMLPGTSITMMKATAAMNEDGELEMTVEKGLLATPGSTDGDAGGQEDSDLESGTPRHVVLRLRGEEIVQDLIPAVD